MLDYHFRLEDYQTAEEQKLITKIMNHEASVKLMDWINEQKIDEVYNTVYRSSFLRLNEQNAPVVMAQLRRACDLFGLEQMPDVYLTRDFDDTITIGGISEPFLLLSSRYLQQLEAEGPELMMGVLAGQVGGIVAGHHRGLLLVWLLNTVTGLIGLPQWAVVSLDALLNDWKRCRIYTCDRAMYLALADYPLALRGILAGTVPSAVLRKMRLGTPGDVYQRQIEAFRKGSEMDEVINVINSLTTDTGWLPLRCHKLAVFAGFAEEDEEAEKEGAGDD